jgi:DNA-directed RNA polymerase beta subunit
LRIINPIAALQDEERNLFTLRQIDYDQILPMVKEIVKPVEEIGFTINEINLKDSRFSSGELAKSLKQTLAIKLQKGSSEIDLSIFIPKLIDGNYVMINGRRKVPLFQLFDIPVVTRGETIKLRTNVATLMIFKAKESPHIQVSFLGKKIPLGLVLLAYYGIDEVKQRYDLSIPVDEDSTNLFDILRKDLNVYCEESIGYTPDDFTVELGRMYSRYNAKSKGQDVLYAIDLIPKVDLITAQFMNHDNILDEISEVLKTGSVDDTLFTNKRVRCFEYMVLAKISKIIFDLCFSNRTARQPKFNINSTQILSDCNVSDIVQFDFSINPIEELTKLSRISLLGPGGFKRENIPKHLRDICPTMFGRLCPVDTPDRDNCGVLQNLVPNVDLDDKWKFTNVSRDKHPLSIPVSMTPFLKHDDQTRLQMAASQMRQSIMLRQFDTPLISSGSEGLYSKYTQFVKTAKKDGEVVYVDKEYIIVMYNDNVGEIFDIRYRKIYVEHMDFMNIYVKVGDKFKAGDILAESNFCKNGHINVGKNLLTGVMVHYGNNYEDGIVISKRLVDEDVLTSVHYEDLSFTLTPDKVLLSLSDKEYKPLPDELETLDPGNPYAILKKMNSDEHYSVFSEPVRLDAKKKFIISEVNLFGNTWNEEVPEYKEWIEKKLESQKDREKYIQKTLKSIMAKDEAMRIIREHSLDKFSFVGKYKEKRERVNGIKVEIYGVHFRKIRVGDKVANRHGNKGVISRIVEHEKMPQLEDGRHLDICINPLGIISRMNIGQLYELHLAMTVDALKKNIIDMLNKNTNQEEIKNYLLGFIQIIDRTVDGWYYKQFKEQLPEKINIEFLDEFTAIQAPFQSCKLKEVEQAMEYVGAEFKYPLYDPLSKEKLTNRVAVGFIYFFRMVHIAEEKLAARGIGAYARRTLQPLGGRKNKGGQRCGEMETACLIGHDAPCNLHEFLTTKSDCIDLKNAYIRDVISTSLTDESKELDTVPESVKLLNSYFTVIGVDHK